MRDFGLSIDGFSPARDIAAQARAAEAGGAARLWIATHLYLRDPVALAAAALAATERLGVALMAMSPYALHPVHAAMAAATLDELYPGRVLLSLGVGAPGDLAAAGIAAPHPARTLGEAIAVCQRLFAGGPVIHDGERFRLSGRALVNGGRAIRVILAATGPRMLALAGREADGVLISDGVSVPHMRHCIGRTIAAADGRRPATCGLVHVRLGPADAPIRRTLGFVLRGTHHAPNLAAAGVRLDQEALRAAYAAGDWVAVDRLITPEVVAAHAATGSVDAVRAKLAAYRATGLDHIVLAGPAEPAEIVRTLAAVGAAPAPR